MKLTKGILDKVFIALIVSLPFNSIPLEYGALGELSGEAGFYVSLVFMMLCGFFYKSIAISKKLIYFFALFLATIVISGLYNYDSIFSNYTKGQSGTEKFIGQLVLMLYVTALSSCFSAYFRMLGANKSISILSYSALVSFLVISLYSIIEIFFNSQAFYYIDSLIHSINYGVDRSRLRSVSGESSWLVCYLMFIFPLALIRLKNMNPMITLTSVVLFITQVYFAQSRFSYPVIIMGIFLPIIAMYRSKHKYGRADLAKIILILPIAIFLTAVTIDQFSSISRRVTYGSKIDLSSLARLESQKAAVGMGNSSPILGLGLGQYGFWMPDYISDEAFRSTEIRLWASSSPSSSWAPAHGLLARIYGELGAISLAMWIFVFTYVFLKYRYSINAKFAALMIMSMHVCVFFVGFNLDSFRYFPYWITLGLAASFKGDQK